MNLNFGHFNFELYNWHDIFKVDLFYSLRKSFVSYFHIHMWLNMKRNYRSDFSKLNYFIHNLGGKEHIQPKKYIHKYTIPIFISFLQFSKFDEPFITWNLYIRIILKLLFKETQQNPTLLFSQKIAKCLNQE